jgi:protein-S-isoprenylcysteine O-methyltransferase Ste14
VYRAFLCVVWLGACTWATLPTFWLIAHPFAARLRRRRRPYVLPLAFWGAMDLLAIAATFHWRGLVLYVSVYAWLIAAIFFAAGIYLYAAARHGFDVDQLAGRHELETDQLANRRLVTGSIRGRMRHPIYAAYFVMMLGLAVATGMPIVYALFIVGAALTIPMVRAEDRELEQRFGDEYRRYKADVSAFGIVPRKKRADWQPATGNSK